MSYKNTLEPRENLYYLRYKLFENQAFSRIFSKSRMVLLDKSTEKLPNDNSKPTKTQAVLA